MIEHLIEHETSTLGKAKVANKLQTLEILCCIWHDTRSDFEAFANNLLCVCGSVSLRLAPILKYFYFLRPRVTNQWPQNLYTEDYHFFIKVALQEE